MPDRLQLMAAYSAEMLDHSPQLSVYSIAITNSVSFSMLLQTPFVSVLSLNFTTFPKKSSENIVCMTDVFLQVAVTQMSDRLQLTLPKGLP